MDMEAVNYALIGLGPFATIGTIAAIVRAVNKKHFRPRVAKPQKALRATAVVQLPAARPAPITSAVAPRALPSAQQFEEAA
jgi:hypothetical protein